MTDQTETLEDARGVVAQFESLGGSGHGCEFGIFQRHCGADPLGLLRWADLGHEALTAALDNRFEGVGQLEHTDIFIPDPHRNSEWWSRDKRYWMAMRTFMTKELVPQEKAQDLILKRLQFLREKLISDLQEGEKIFVYKNLFRNLTYDELAALYLAARSYGSNTMLYLRYADADHADGSVERLTSGLMVGAVDHFSFSPTDEALGAPNESFLTICRSALQLWSNPDITGDRSDVARFHIALADRLARKDRAAEALAAAETAVGFEPQNPHAQNGLATLLLRAKRAADAEIPARAAVAAAPDVVTFHDTLAVSLARQGKTKELLAVLECAVELGPNDAERQRRIGRTLLQLGRAGEAEAALKRAIALKPDLMAAHDLLADALRNQERWTEAVAPAQRTVELMPTAGEAVPARIIRQHRLAHTLMRSGDLAEAERVLQAVGPLPSAMLIAHHHHLLGLVLQSQGRLDEAIVAASQACSAEPQHADLHGRVALMLLLAGRNDEAEAAARAAIECSPENPAYRDTLVSALQRKGSQEEALIVAQSAADLAPNDARRQISLGKDLLTVGRLAEAEALFRRAITASPDSVAAYEELGFTLERMTRLDEAATAALRAAELAPNNTELNGRAAALLLRQGRPREAETLLLRTIEPRPNDIGLRRLLCSALEAQQRMPDVIERAREILEIEPNQPANANYLANFLLRAQKPDEAEKVLREAVARTPTAVILYETLSHALTHQRKAKDAIATLRSACELPDAPFSTFLRLGELLDDTGDLEEAEKVLRRAVAIDQNAENAQKRLTAVVARRQYIEATSAYEETAGSPPATSLSSRNSPTESAGQRSGKKERSEVAEPQRDERLFSRVIRRTWRATGRRPTSTSYQEPIPPISAISLARPDADRKELFAAVEAMTGISVRNLIMNYESLGENCEFGFLQRICGAEPLSLTRFAGISLHEMVAGLDAGFAGMADPDNLLIDGPDLWMVRDKIYNLVYHTFLKCEKIPSEEVRRHQSKRLEFLRNKFLDDVARGDKTYVVWRRDPLTETDVVPLLDALRRRGPAWLIYLVPTQPAGVTEIIRPGLIRGNIDRLSPNGSINAPSVAGWLTTLVNAWTLHH